MFSRQLAALSLLACTVAANLHAPSNFVQTDGAKFTLQGRSYYFAGTNAYWFQFLTVRNLVKYLVTSSHSFLILGF
jgi:mannan endo-1,4-beta-mannosidase